MFKNVAMRISVICQVCYTMDTWTSQVFAQFPSCYWYPV